MVGMRVVSSLNPRPRRDDPEPERWQDRALCAQVDPEVFFPEKGGSTREAKMVCRRCEVTAECLDYAMSHMGLGQGGGYSVGDWGVWGSLSLDERRILGRRAAA